MFTSLQDAQKYCNKLPLQLEQYLDPDYQQALDRTIESLNQFFDVALTINHQAADKQHISTREATEIGEHGFTLLLKLIDLMEKLELPKKRKEIEQIALIFARWTIQHQGRLNHIEPLVNAFAHAANNMRQKKSLHALVEFMSMVIDACADNIKHDIEDSSLYRPWRLLLVNRGLIATRTYDIELIRQVFDELVLYLPQEATEFFDEGVREIENLDYPDSVRQIIQQYHRQQPKIRLH